MNEMLPLISQNLLSPIILAFVLGVAASILRSDLRFPEAIYQGLSIYLLFAIGLKGGAFLSESTFATVWRASLAAIAIGTLTPVIAFLIFHLFGRFNRSDAGAIAAHFGSVSAVTFIAGLNFLQALKVPSEPFLPALVAMMEIPGIVVGIVLAHMSRGHLEAGHPSMMSIVKSVLVGKSVVLLMGGFFIGVASGMHGFESVSPFFVDPFKGVLALFLLEMGVLAAQRLRDLKKAGPFLAIASVAIPIVHGTLGVVIAKFAGLSVGGAFIMGLLAASGSYIAAPAAVRTAIPDANPTFYLTASLGVAFPFNLTVGIPLYYAIAQAIA